MAGVLFLVLSLAVAAPATAATGDKTSPTASDSKGTSDTAKNEDNGKAEAPGQVKKDESASDDEPTTTGGTSGDPDEPQPVSNADENDGGANGDCPDDGPYCSPRDGKDSKNGQGEGKAEGKPCAGCVGKADNKNPPGQMPDGTDDNKGYECDKNNGIGKTNPAHTGCKKDDDDEEEPPPPEEPPSPPTPPTPPENPPPPEQPPGPPPGEVPPPEVAPTEAIVPRPPAEVLPQAGLNSELGLVGLGGMSLLTAGAFTLWRQRRTRTE
ncbi:MAG TPA: hypothetical protein VLB03_04385 [Nocardioidaceae bacterium]|nr:hypothetical protein [Nocardioidaceae bacterium]